MKGEGEARGKARARRRAPEIGAAGSANGYASDENKRNSMCASEDSAV